MVTRPLSLSLSLSLESEATYTTVQSQERRGCASHEQGSQIKRLLKRSMVMAAGLFWRARSEPAVAWLSPVTKYSIRRDAVLQAKEKERRRATGWPCCAAANRSVSADLELEPLYITFVDDECWSECGNSSPQLYIQ
jgi:hypothetical protein